MPVPHRYLTIYGDESSQQKRHIVYGTVACEAADVPLIVAHLDAAIGSHRHELKWNSVGRDNYAIYESFATTLFDWIIRRKRLRFRSIVIDGQKANYKQFSGGDRALGLQQFIFALLYTYAQDHKHRDASVAVYLDHSDQRYSLDFQRQYLNRRDRSEHGRSYDLFTVVEPVESKNHRLVQAADLIAGAIAFVTRKDHLAQHTGQEKKDLASYIAELAQIPVIDRYAKRKGIKPGDIETLGIGTPSHAGLKGVGIWHLDWGAQHEIELRKMSKDQLAHFPKNQTFEDIKRQGYIPYVVCPRCQRRHEDILRDAGQLGHRRISDPLRLRCINRRCHADGIVLLEPDPLLPIFAPRR